MEVSEVIWVPQKIIQVTGPRVFLVVSWDPISEAQDPTDARFGTMLRCFALAPDGRIRLQIVRALGVQPGRRISEDTFS